MRIYALMQTNPEKLWTYDELSLLLGAVKKTVCSRCLDLYNEDMIDKVMVKTGRPRGRKCLLFIKPIESTYPSWLVPSPPSPQIKEQTTVSARHWLDRGTKKTLAN